MRPIVPYLALILAVIFAATAARSHDEWISRGGFRNAAGEWCCGEHDCEKVPKVGWESGWVVDGERHRFNEFTPSPDGEVCVCRRPAMRSWDYPRSGGKPTIRCLFGPQPGS